MLPQLEREDPYAHGYGRNARPAGWEPRRKRRLLIFPAELWCCGHRPNHEVNCFTVANRLTSAPTSLRITNAVLSSIPSRDQYPQRDVGPVIKDLVGRFGPDSLIYGGGFGAGARPRGSGVR